MPIDWIEIIDAGKCWNLVSEDSKRPSPNQVSNILSYSETIHLYWKYSRICFDNLKNASIPRKSIKVQPLNDWMFNLLWIQFLIAFMVCRRSRLYINSKNSLHLGNRINEFPSIKKFRTNSKEFWEFHEHCKFVGNFGKKFREQYSREDVGWFLFWRKNFEPTPISTEIVLMFLFFIFFHFRYCVEFEVVKATKACHKLPPYDALAEGNFWWWKKDWKWTNELSWKIIWFLLNRWPCGNSMWSWSITKRNRNRGNYR